MPPVVFSEGKMWQAPAARISYALNELQRRYRRGQEIHLLFW